MELIKFAKENNNWVELLQQKPFNIVVRKLDNYILLKYDMIESDMSNLIVKECRGVILDETSLEVVCRPFDKFFNSGESQAAKLVGNIRAEEKIDGSIIKMWFHKDKWNISTNGCIDASDAPIKIKTDEFENFKELFQYTFNKYNIELNDFEDLKEYTLMFELISPVNRVVVSYKDDEICLIGIRHTKTGKEICVQDFDHKISKTFRLPKIYNINSIEEALDAAKELSFNEEGYVLVDNFFNRVKVKGAEYLSLHRMSPNDLTPKGFLVTILNNNQDDLLAYFPEYEPYIKDVENKLKDYIFRVEEAFKTAPWDSDKKTFAMAVKDYEFSYILFQTYKTKNFNWKEWVLDIENKNKLSFALKLN